MVFDIGVDALRISFKCRLRLVRQFIVLAFRRAVDAERSHHFVRRQRPAPNDFGETALADATVEVHLLQPVLGMGEAERVIGGVQRVALNVRDTV